MNSTIKDLLLSLQENQPIMVEQLHQFCEINSGTYNQTGLQIMHQKLVDAFQPLADKVDSLSLPGVTTMDMKGNITTLRSGDTLFIRKRPKLKRRILLAGHMDTVFSINHPFQKLTFINDNHLNGPGVADMKGGLIVMLHALSAFEQTKESKLVGWDVLINADEEIGSPASSALFNDLASHYQAGLVYEPAMDSDGTLAKNRKGSGKLTLLATGKAAHAGRAFYDGRNAICYLAEAVTAIHALNGKRDGVTINVGKIAGGTALNIVPEKAIAKLDVRISQPNDEYWVRDELNQIIQNLKHPDYSLTVHGNFNRPVKRVSGGTERLYQRIKSVGQALGLTLNWQDSGGCCDGNNLAAQGLPVIDTLGVRGGNIHSEDEFILIDSLVERARLSALILMDLAQGGLEELII
ncbi:carboxypeptidase G2 [Legionella beliardensis]|uniref:Carboxypeptidase G2 n=1 Tax=Legionella beliardensis TaxID=91822 RepID=A0A378I252_9GAMM|nr:hydrolase [Legionella beliardensis]STX29259.1 carboxypeptidase G2 [Legionella beliardensis]